jgi:hypothetical protein
MYEGVPTIVPTCVRCVRSVSVMRATPKSISFARFCASSMMFAGLMSRWTMPASCA